MARKRERAVALVVVVLFVMTSFGFTLFLIWQETHNTSTSDGSVVGSQLTNFTPTSNVPTIKVSDEQVGKGAAVQAGDNVNVYYTGALANTGTIFSSTSTTGQAANIKLNQTIIGWRIGVPGMKVGGTRRLLIPAAMAYGASPPAGSGIPANTPLVFDVTLLSFSK
jgi:peptidylprolyl isomerase